MAKVSIIAKLTAADGKAGDLEASLQSMVVAAEEEAGLEIYSVFKNPKEENVFWFFELYSDEESVKVHGKGELMKPAMREVGGLLAGPPEVTVVNPVVAKGLEF